MLYNCCGIFVLLMLQVYTNQFQIVLLEIQYYQFYYCYLLLFLFLIGRKMFCTFLLAIQQLKFAYHKCSYILPLLLSQVELFCSFLDTQKEQNNNFFQKIVSLKIITIQGATFQLGCDEFQDFKLFDFFRLMEAGYILYILITSLG
eukprot:TRINITY_DN4556_c0_g2_i1.p1 TRINITY_DN4556_c0_g2~~TRINITY_DN4556_c0_g2_i1.p1  ORF type:complete len:146 (+),score=4.49 TRINITY_DN4556_c0_g2_i1:170-607(+)